LSAEFSVAQILANLETQMAFHREREEEHGRQEVFHREQETFHREQRALHAAEHETVAKHYEAFKASAGSAAEIAARNVVPAPAPEPPPREETPPPPLKKVMASRLVARLVRELPAGERFAPSQVAREVNRRYPRELRKPIVSRLASTALRRLLAEGAVQLVQKGTAHREAVYTRR
jgi:hypothetical protein